MASPILHGCTLASIHDWRVRVTEE